MKLWKIFFPPSEVNSSINSIHDELLKTLEGEDEKVIISVACISGLLAQVAFSDMKIDQSEVECIRNSLKEYTNFSDKKIEAITEICQKEILHKVDSEHHLYLRPLNQLFSKEEKQDILKMLFQVAAADGEVENIESEEIRLIAKGLRLGHEHFIQAKLTVKDKIKALS